MIWFLKTSVNHVEKTIQILGKIINKIKVMENKTKCYCNHTDYCDCAPLEELKQETPRIVTGKQIGRAHV